MPDAELQQAVLLLVLRGVETYVEDLAQGGGFEPLLEELLARRLLVVRFYDVTEDFHHLSLLTQVLGFKAEDPPEFVDDVFLEEVEH